jgi:hypothetical protein
VHGFNGWEIDVVVEFFQLLKSNNVKFEGPDGLRWKLRQVGIFHSQSF